MNKRNVGRFYIIIGLMCFILNGCDPKHDVEKITDYDKTESTEKVSEKLETVGTEAVSETVTEITENIPEKQNMQEPEWQMSSEEKDAFKMILLGTYLDDIESNTLSLEKNRKSKELDNVDKYSFLINFRKGGNGDSLELLYNVQEWYMIVSEEQANDILKSAYGDGFQEDMYTVLTKIVGNGMEGDYDEYIMNGGAYITPLGDNMYNIFNADDGDTEYKIEIKQAEMLNKEQCNVNAFIDIDVANERFQRYSVNAIFNKNEDSIFAGYTLDSSTITKVDVGMLDWKEAYKKALFCRMLDDGTYFYSECFALHDFDNDGIPELLLPVYPSDKGWYAEDMWSNSDIWNESYTWQGGLIARYDNGKVVTAYDMGSSLVPAAYGDLFYGTGTEHLIIYEGNGVGNPVEIFTYQNGRFYLSQRIYATMGEEYDAYGAYKITTYDEAGNIIDESGMSGEKLGISLDCVTEKYKPIEEYYLIKQDVYEKIFDEWK